MMTMKKDIFNYDSLITEFDLYEIKNMPEPNFEQAQHVIRNWRTQFEGRIPNEKDYLNYKINYKLFLKVKLYHPEYLI